MKKMLVVVIAAIALLAIGSAASAYEVTYDFNTPWTSDYAPGWENTDYRHGAPPVAQMMEYTTGGVGGTGGVKLVGKSAPSDSMFWVGVNPIVVDGAAMAKAYNPYISAWYYDEGWESGASLHSAGQIFAVPSWVNPYISPGEDWTDVQFGARTSQAPPNDNYWYVASGQSSPGWRDTGVDRFTASTPGWVNLKMQLSNTDGKIHFFVNGVEKGTTYRSDYIDLGEEVGLFTMYTNPLSSWGANKPSTIWDNFVMGSSYPVPEPATMLLLGLGLIGLAGARRKITK